MQRPDERRLHPRAVADPRAHRGRAAQRLSRQRDAGQSADDGGQPLLRPRAARAVDAGGHPQRPEPRRAARLPVRARAARRPRAGRGRQVHLSAAQGVSAGRRHARADARPARTCRSRRSRRATSSTAASSSTQIAVERRRPPIRSALTGAARRQRRRGGGDQRRGERAAGRLRRDRRPRAGRGRAPGGAGQFRPHRRDARRLYDRQFPARARGRRRRRRPASALTHRVAVHLTPGPCARRRARRRARGPSPALDAWLASVLPPLDRDRLRGRPGPTRPAARSQQPVTLADLGLRPIDLLGLVKPDAVAGDDRARRPHRCASRIAAAAPRPDAALTIAYMTAPAGQAQRLRAVRRCCAALRTLVIRRAAAAGDRRERCSSDANADQNAPVFVDRTRDRRPQRPSSTRSGPTSTPILAPLARCSPTRSPTARAIVCRHRRLARHAPCGLLERAARFGVPQSGWGFAYAWRTARRRRSAGAGRGAGRRAGPPSSPISTPGSPPTTRCRRRRRRRPIASRALRSWPSSHVTPDLAPATPGRAARAARRQARRLRGAARPASPRYSTMTRSAFRRLPRRRRGAAAGRPHFDPQPFDLDAVRRPRRRAGASDLRAQTCLAPAVADHGSARRRRRSSPRTMPPATADAHGRQALSAAAKALLGDDFRIVPEFALAAAQADEWANAVGRVDQRRAAELADDHGADRSAGRRVALRRRARAARCCTRWEATIAARRRTRPAASRASDPIQFPYRRRTRRGWRCSSRPTTRSTATACSTPPITRRRSTRRAAVRAAARRMDRGDPGHDAHHRHHLQLRPARQRAAADDPARHAGVGERRMAMGRSRRRAQRDARPRQEARGRAGAARRARRTRRCCRRPSWRRRSTASRSPPSLAVANGVFRDLEAHRMPSALARRRHPRGAVAAAVPDDHDAGTGWRRGRARTSFDRALRAEVRDPLWMLTKQWQMGEFRGSDAGSPVFAKLQIDTTRLTKYRPDAQATQPFDDDVPLEAKVERRPVPLRLAGGPIAFDLRLAMGRHWLELIDASSATATASSPPTRSPRPTRPARRTPSAVRHPEVWQMFAAVAGRAMDGGVALPASQGQRRQPRLRRRRRSRVRRHRRDRSIARRRFVAWFERAAAAAARGRRRLGAAACSNTSSPPRRRCRRRREGLRRRRVRAGPARLVQPRRRRHDGGARSGARLARPPACRRTLRRR